MNRLINKSKNITVVEKVNIALGFKDRLVGLLGKTNLPSDEALWISKTNSIHTYFMKFNIDAIFVDKNLVVKSIHKNLKPWRITFPKFTADSVFELAAGVLDEKSVSKGDQLHVGP